MKYLIHRKSTHKIPKSDTNPHTIYQVKGTCYEVQSLVMSNKI
jgi:hypothetical protein